MLSVCLFLGLSCGGSTANQPAGKGGKDETAAERARREHAESEEGRMSDQGKKWGGWRYKGARDDCFYRVGRRCFVELEAACSAAKCKGKGVKACKVEGGGPAFVSCR